MRFALTDDQLAFRDAVRAVLDKHCTPDVVRTAWSADEQIDRGVWDALAEMGVLHVLVPEDEGGLGLDAESLVPVLEEAGRAGLPLPLVETALVAAPLDPSLVGSSLVATDLGGPIVANALDADLFLLHDGAGLHLVSRDHVVLAPVDTVDGARRAARIDSFTNSTPVDASVDDAFTRGVLGVSAVLVGLSERMLTMTVAYVREREQFGVPVGSFQAVKHHLADALKDLSFARPAVRRAAHSVANASETVDRDVAMAKAMASDAADVVGRAALQCHGAIGYTVEYDLHLFLKRAWALSRSWGDAAFHRARIAESLNLR